MAEVEERVEFYTRADQVKFVTQTNGDKIIIDKLDLTQDQATSLAWLVNADNQVELSFEVKIKGM